LNNVRNHTITVLIASDNYIIRSGLRRTLETQTRIRVLGDVSLENSAAMGDVLRQQPRLVIVDLDSHRQDVLTVIRTIQKNSKNSSILVLTDLSNHELATKALSLGAAGLVLKVQPVSILLTAIHELCPLLELKSASRKDVAIQRPSERRSSPAPLPPSNSTNSSDEQARIATLTRRELDVIRLIALGLKNKDIATQLSISDITVRHHLTNIFRKLEISDRQKLLILAHNYELADLRLNAESA